MEGAVRWPHVGRRGSDRGVPGMACQRVSCICLGILRLMMMILSCFASLIVTNLGMACSDLVARKVAAAAVWKMS